MSIEQIESVITALSDFERISKGAKFCTVRKYRDYFHAVNAYVLQGAKKPEAVTWVADDFRVSEDSVYRGLRFFNAQTHC